ncbi:MAG: helix-turn-helix transcriptional regulator [Clostridia bacterium]|jgi:transcriptional regulator with XRE-family HTH domain|nr:helix-turn-helix transcriptional regulator [Clostridia bacterium]MBQ7090847.1 helix-turn-helix transcriptional regulator [Clostridia bacterium]
MKRIIDGEQVNIIGPQIKAARMKAGMSQKQLSEKLELMAVYTCRGSISRIENGKRAVTDIEIDAISKVLDVSLDDLFNR